jgi:hypothetical protein
MTANSTESTTYSISVKAPETVTRLYEGVPFHETMPEKGNPKKFYFYMNGKRNYTVQEFR